MSAEEHGQSGYSPESQDSNPDELVPYLVQSHNEVAMEEDESSQEKEVEESKEEPVNKELFVVQIPSEIRSKFWAVLCYNLALCVFIRIASRPHTLRTRMYLRERV